MNDGLRGDIVRVAAELERRGLNHNSAGNVSARLGADMLVTPSGIPAGAMQPADIVHLALDGTPWPDPLGRRPSSEWRLHAAIYAGRSDVSAIVHTHSIEATAAACVGRPIPAVHYVVARAGDVEIPCAPYATYGSVELAANVVGALGRRGRACLMANHGMVAVGESLDDALTLAHDVEWLASVRRRAHQLGVPVVLDPDEIARVAEQLRDYGQPR
ncbi:MAG: class II aldolase/adducin family protein [Acidimicrobiia bacterium]